MGLVTALHGDSFNINVDGTVGSEHGAHWYQERRTTITMWAGTTSASEVGNFTHYVELAGGRLEARQNSVALCVPVLGVVVATEVNRPIMIT